MDTGLPEKLQNVKLLEKIFNISYDIASELIFKSTEYFINIVKHRYTDHSLVEYNFMDRA